MFPLIRFFLNCIGSLAPPWPNAPDPATAEQAAIISYRDNVPTRDYLLAGLAVVLIAMIWWAVASYIVGHRVPSGSFFVAVVFGWPAVCIWIHMSLQDRYPEVPYIWCDDQSVSIEGRCRIF